MDNRYIISSHVEHGCCYVAMLIDTCDKSHHGGGQFIAEFATEELAEKVCRFLNEEESNGSEKDDK